MIRRLVGLLVLLVLAAPAWAATYYVGKSGSNGNSCASATSPTATNRKLTIAAGVGCLSGGDTLVIGAGVYNEVLGFNAGINDASIPSGSGPGGEAIEAAWPGATVIRAESPCSGTSCTTILRASAPADCASGVALVWVAHQTAKNYIIFQGFEADANSNCVQVARLFTQFAIEPPHHIRIQNVYFHDSLASAGGSGLIENHTSAPSGNHSHHIEVLDSVITRHSMAGSFPAAGGNHCVYWNADGAIRRNVISYCSPTDGNGQAIGTHSGPAGYVVDISGNDIHHFGYQGIEASGTLNGKIYNNTIHDGSTRSCVFSGFPDVYTCAGISINGSYGATNTLVANNTLYNVTSRNGGGIAFEAGASTTNTTIQNNILFGGDHNTITGTGGGTVTISTNRCDSGCATAANPEFVNGPAGNFHLTATSPTAITAGGVTLSSIFTTDKDGTTRPVPWSLGAYAAIPPFVPSFPTVSDFPSTGLIDQFDRANGGLGSNYTQILGSDPFVIAGNQAAAGATYALMLWNAATVSPKHEVYGTLPTPPGLDQAAAFVYAAPSLTVNNQWRLFIYRPSGANSSMQVKRTDGAGAETQLLNVDLGTVVPNNNTFGVRVEPPTITIYWKYTDEVWYRVGQVNDATLPTTGTARVGFGGVTPQTLDNLGGGTCCGGAVSPANIGRFGATFPTP